MCLKILWLVARTPLTTFDGYVHICHNDYIYGVYMTTKILDCRCDHGVKGQCQPGTNIVGTGFLSILPILLPTRDSGIRRDKYLSAAIFKKAVHSDDP